MAKQLNQVSVNLSFSADTGKAKAQLQDLQNQLNNLVLNTKINKNSSMAGQIQNAVKSAAELNVYLQKATNIKTGSLDFSKLNESLKRSNKSLEQYAEDLIKLGPEGQKAFQSLAESIVNSEIPLKRSNALLNEMWTTLKNSARWQISSSILHGFMGSVKSAYGYAQDLNESLNNIRIVTGQNVDQMAKFASEANKAAKTLSTTTTAYTDAALIYYQQGLDDTQVKERTDVTIKMANVSRQSAEEVSDQLTAIWNNFYDGSQSLEHFADVMTRLGADTASSSDEIAQGLEKFAAIGNMIGLSFDNAAAALATVTATTRQSADVVGTAFKTIFARIQGLSLGETLDDGTNLNKYSKALDAVGINIKEQNGELKGMDSILAEMGAKWKTLSKDQQVALAQTVAGVRQYNQLIALMDHFDFYEKNLNAAQNSDGSLQKQADIYAESWEAAQKRVKAALEDIFGKVIDDKFFIELTNTIAKAVGGVSKLIDALGGVKGLLLAISALATKAFSQQLSQGLTNLAYTVKMSTKKGRESVAKERQDQINNLSGITASDEYSTKEEEYRAKGLRDILDLQSQIAEKADQMNEYELAGNKALLERIKILTDIRTKTAQQLEDVKTQKSDAVMEGRIAIAKRFSGHKEKYKKNAIDQTTTSYQDHVEVLRQKTQEKIDLQNKIKQKQTKNKDYQISAEESTQLVKINEIIEARSKQIDKLTKIEGLGKKISQGIQEELNLDQQIKQETEEIKEGKEDLEQKIKDSTGAQATWADGLVATSQVITGTLTAFNALSSAFDALNDPDLSGMEKLQTVVMSLASAIPMLTMAINSQTLATIKSGAADAVKNIALALKIPLTVQSAAATGADAVAEGTDTAAIELNTLALLKNIAVKLLFNPLAWAAVAAIAAISIALYESAKAYDADANAAKGTADTVEKLTERYNELTTAADEFKSAVSGYEDAVNGLNELDQQTQEYADALEDANKKAQDLVETYGLWGQTYKENGLIKFNDGVLESAQEKKDQEARSAENALYGAKISNNQAQLESSKTNISRKIGYLDTGEIGPEGTQQYAQLTKNDISTLSQMIKTAQDQVLSEGGDLKTVLSDLISENNELSNAAKNNIDAILESKESLLSFADSVEQAKLANEDYANRIVRNDVEEKYGEQFKEQAGEDAVLYNQMLDAQAARTKRRRDENNQSLEEQLSSVNEKAPNNASIGVKNDEDLARTYAKEVLGMSQEEVDNLSYKGGTNKGTLKDATGNNVLNEQSDDFMRQAIANERKRQEIINSYNENANSEEANDAEWINNFVEKSTKAAETLGADFTGVFLDSLTNGTQDLDFSSIFQNLSPAEYLKLTDEKLTEEDLIKLFGFTEEDIKNLGYNTTSEFQDAVQEALKKYDENEYIKNVENSANQKAKDLGIDEKEFKAYRDLLGDSLNKEQKDPDYYKKHVDGINEVAIANKRMEKGVKTLAKDWNSYNKVMKDSDASLEDVSAVLPDINDGLQDILNLDNEDFELLPNDFAQKNWSLVQDVMNGVEGSIDTLRDKAGEEILLNVIGESDFSKVDEELQGLQQKIEDFDGKQFDVGVNIEDTDFIATCDALIAKAGMTAEQAQAYFKAMGYDAEIEEKEVQKTTKRTVEYPKIDPRTGYPTGEKGTLDLLETVGTTAYAIKTITPNGSYGGGIGVNTTAPEVARTPKKSGGSSSKASKVSMTKKSDVVDRYKEIDDQLDDINDELSRANKLTDRLFGAKRLQQMDKEISILNKQSKALEKKRKEAENYLKIDKQAVLDLNKKYGTQFKIDNSGLVSNYEDELNKLYSDLHAAEQKSQSYYTSGASKDAQDKFNQSTLEPIKEKISIIKEVLSQYDETRELFEDLNDQIQDINNQIQDLNYEKIQYKLELKVDIEDAELKRLDYFLNKFSDDFYKMAESAALMQDKIQPASNILGDYKENVNELNKAYANGDISQADYIDGLKNARDAIYEQLEALNELDKQMLHYYEDTLSAATDELADHTDHMEHLTSVFEHYQNLLGIIGKSKDYEAMGNFLQGQADTIKDRLSVAQSYYDVLLQQKDEIQAELQAAIASGDKAKIEMYQKEWDAIVDETDAAQEQVLSLTEEWAEAMKSVIQNNMEKIADTLEKTLTGGTTFDTLMDGFDKLNTRQEEYLTKTNQIYETNKLMRTASKALDETDNKVAKQKLKNFIDETKGLQETTQLSKYELEIQQAKYDLLLAQIALEEAQNAKSTVRLSRDSEGNFGYVYTADQNKIDDAQQAVDDADNSLYNLSLEGQQQYTEKYLQAQQSMYEELKQLQQDYLDGNIASEEEYERIKEQILNHYLGSDGVLTTYQNLYNVAVRTDANATADYWGQEYGRMTQDTETWKTAVNNYLLEIDGQIEEWKNVQTTANQEVGGALSNSKKATEELTIESEKLKDTINDEVIPTISDEIDAVKEQTDAYAAQRAELQALINTYENYLSALDATISANSIGFDKNTDYSALMNEYLNSGGKTTDKAFQDLLKQRNAKIEWLESDAGGNKGSEYWGTKGADTLAYYETLTSGGGSEEQRAWFEKDYMTKDEMLDKLNNLGISTEELELAINEVKASTDTVGEKITETGNNTNTKLEEVGNNTNSKIEETNNNTNSKIDETKDNLNTSINDSKDTLNTSIESNRDETVTSLGDINNTIENRSDEIIGSIGDAASDIIGSIGSAASEISSSVGGAISSMRSEISSLRGSVTGSAIGSIAGPVGKAIGGVIGGAIAKAKRYDTGGYTGDWGPEGKLAILDQKELVLNQNDTQNLLSTVSLIRELVSMIDAQAANASLFNLMSSPSPNTNTNTLEQKVEITAEFPNVNDRYEIEEAFNNLVNRASQYANKVF